MTHRTHLGVYGLVSAQGKVALIKKCRGPYTGQWDLPGGTIEFGETPAETLAREIQEELGLTLAAAQLCDAVAVRFTFQNQSGETTDLHHIGIIYTCQVASPERLRSCGDGIDASEAGWFSVSELAQRALTPFAKLHLGQQPRITV